MSELLRSIDHAINRQAGSAKAHGLEGNPHALYAVELGELLHWRECVEKLEAELEEEREASLRIMETAESRIEAAENGEEWDEDAARAATGEVTPCR